MRITVVGVVLIVAAIAGVVLIADMVARNRNRDKGTEQQ